MCRLSKSHLCCVPRLCLISKACEVRGLANSGESNSVEGKTHTVVSTAYWETYLGRAKGMYSLLPLPVFRIIPIFKLHLTPWSVPPSTLPHVFLSSLVEQCDLNKQTPIIFSSHISSKTLPVPPRIHFLHVCLILGCN